MLLIYHILRTEDGLHIAASILSMIDHILRITEVIVGRIFWKIGSKSTRDVEAAISFTASASTYKKKRENDR